MSVVVDRRLAPDQHHREFVDQVEIEPAEGQGPLCSGGDTAAGRGHVASVPVGVVGDIVPPALQPGMVRLAARQNRTALTRLALEGRFLSAPIFVEYSHPIWPNEADTHSGLFRRR